MAMSIKKGEPDVIPIGVYYRGLDGELHQFSVLEDCPVEARRLVKVELDKEGTKTIGPVLAIIRGR